MEWHWKQTWLDSGTPEGQWVDRGGHVFKVGHGQWCWTKEVQYKPSVQLCVLVVVVKDRGVYLQHNLSSVHHLGARRAQYTPSSWGYLALPHLYIVRGQLCSCPGEILLPHINCDF